MIAWMVQVRCDGCGRYSTAVAADRANYGQTVRELRAKLAAGGWTADTTHRHYDWCPPCSQRRTP